MTAPIRNSPQNQSPRNQPGGRRTPRLGTGFPSSENSFERKKRRNTPMPEKQAKRTKRGRISVKYKNDTTGSISHNFNKKTEKSTSRGTEGKQSCWLTGERLARRPRSHGGFLAIDQSLRAHRGLRASFSSSFSGTLQRTKVFSPRYVEKGT